MQFSHAFGTQQAKIKVPMASAQRITHLLQRTDRALRSEGKNGRVGTAANSLFIIAHDSSDSTNIPPAVVQVMTPF